MEHSSSLTKTGNSLVDDQRDVARLRNASMISRRGGWPNLVLRGLGSAWKICPLIGRRKDEHQVGKARIDLDAIRWIAFGLAQPLVHRATDGAIPSVGLISRAGSLACI